MQASGIRRVISMSLLMLVLAVVGIAYNRLRSPSTDADTKVELTVSAELANPNTAEVGSGSSRPQLRPSYDDLSGGISHRAPSNPPENPSLSDDAVAGRLVEPVSELRPDALSEIDPTGLPDPGTKTGGGVLRFVYFIEQDQVFDPLALELIKQQATSLQAFWFEQFGATFYLAEDIVDVVYGDQPASWYDEEPNGDDPRWYRLRNMRNEVRAKLSIAANDDFRIVAYPSARIDGRVGANRYGGAWMDGDDVSCMTGEVATVPYSADFPASCLATVAHELGHVYGLGHQGSEEDCMQFGFYQYVIGDGLCEFSQENRELILADDRNSTWLEAKPGDRR